MNKKKFLTTLSIAAVAIVSGYGGMKAYQSHAVNYSDLLAENIDALSNGESGYFVPCNLMEERNCVYNATDASGQKITITLKEMEKAAPFK